MDQRGIAHFILLILVCGLIFGTGALYALNLFHNPKVTMKPAAQNIHGVLILAVVREE
jgi:hypothetical protein